eukprot:335552-Pyramimonas_sp.AAC.1
MVQFSRQVCTGAVCPCRAPQQRLASPLSPRPRQDGGVCGEAYKRLAISWTWISWLTWWQKW